MCGICGILNLDGKDIDNDVLIAMNNSMLKRGPDDSGVYTNRNIGIAMRRLSIIDLAGGQQPISNEDGNIHLIFNGEIYNYIELREDLQKKGHAFKTGSDVCLLYTSDAADE